VASGSAIRGTRVGSGPMRQSENCEPAPRREIGYWCANGQDAQNPPGKPRAEPYKSHLAYVKERRSDADGAAILDEALARLRQRRGEI